MVVLSLTNAAGLALRGTDAWAAPDFSPALERARDSGDGTVSGLTTFPRPAGQGSARPVFIYPVFHPGQPLSTLEERRAAIRGFVFGTLDLPSLFAGIFEAPGDGQVSAKLFAGNALNPGDSLFASASDGARNSRFQRDVPVPVANREWRLVLSSSPAFESGTYNQLPPIVLGLGVSVNLLLFGIAWAQARARREAERLAEDLRGVQERDRLLERATNDAIWDWDIQSHRLVWNEAVQAMFRYSSEALTPQLDWWLERLHSDDRRRVWNGREAAVQTGGEFWADEYRFRRGDGSFAYVIDRGFIIHDRQGVAVRMIGSMVDISAQREAEEARRQSERKLALHIQQTPLAVIEWNLSFGTRRRNASSAMRRARPRDAMPLTSSSS